MRYQECIKFVYNYVKYLLKYVEKNEFVIRKKSAIRKKVLAEEKKFS